MGAVPTVWMRRFDSTELERIATALRHYPIVFSGLQYRDAPACYLSDGLLASRNEWCSLIAVLSR